MKHTDVLRKVQKKYKIKYKDLTKRAQTDKVLNLLKLLVIQNMMDIKED